MIVPKFWQNIASAAARQNTAELLCGRRTAVAAKERVRRSGGLRREFVCLVPGMVN
jgi:hypothetical protein